jgi:phosphatidylglycerophosphate synthase
MNAAAPMTIVEAYRRTAKPKDIPWNRFVARPLAAVLLPGLAPSRITPNQITFASLAVFLIAAAMLMALPGHGALIGAIVVLELSYVLDCVDGQLARLRGTSSPVGAHLDFLMDEIKAFVLVAAVAVRLWRADPGPGGVWFLVEGLVALAAVASAISLTTFVRRPEYVSATGAAPPPASGDYGAGLPGAEPPKPRSPAARVIGAVEALGRLVIHYPSYLVLVALVDRLDLFLHAYLAVNAAHAARCLAGVARKLGKAAPTP